MNKILAGILAVAMLVVAGCGALPGFDGDRPAGVALASEKERVTDLDLADVDLDALVEGNTTFALDLYRYLAQEQGAENLFFSPYSISLALAMTYAGARGETEQEMARALQFMLDQAELHRAFNALDQELARRGEGAEGRDDEGFRLNIANAIWGQEEYEFLNTFLDTLAENYGAGLRILDFAGAPEESRLVINDWVSDETEGKIEDLIPKGAIDALTRLVLTNAIYFNAAWARTFPTGLTQDGPFTLLDGSQVQVPMMRQTASFRYGAGADYEAVELPYDGHEMSMVVLLPAEGELESFEGALNASRVQAIIGELEVREVVLTMPKFEYEAMLGLEDALMALGMERAFSGDADFSGMTGEKGLFISDVVHKAFVAVDEEGTEAAAATAVIVAESMAPEQVEMTIDRPFIFLIRDIQTGTILFVGRVANPTA